jgi:acyl carrier protein
MKIEEKLLEIFSVVLEIPENENPMEVRRMNYQRWDSLAHVSIIVAIESEFSIELDVKDWERISSFASTSLLIEEKMG